MEAKQIVFSVLAVGPSLLAYLTACILGLVFLNKHKTPALLAMLGGMLAGVVVLGSLVIREVMWAGARDGNGDFEKTANLTQLIAIGANLFEAVGMGLIVFAVFAGRKGGQPARERWQEEDDDRRREARRRD